MAQVQLFVCTLQAAMKDETGVCSVHGKQRSYRNMMDDGSGGFRCLLDDICDAKVRPGDWSCGVCGDLQFAKNASCRSCGAAKGAAVGGKGKGANGGKGSKGAAGGWWGDGWGAKGYGKEGMWGWGMPMMAWAPMPMKGFKGMGWGMD